MYIYSQQMLERFADRLLYKTADLVDKLDDSVPLVGEIFDAYYSASHELDLQEERGKALHGHIQRHIKNGHMSDWVRERDQEYVSHWLETGKGVRDIKLGLGIAGLAASATLFESKKAKVASAALGTYFLAGGVLLHQGMTELRQMQHDLVIRK